MKRKVAWLMVAVMAAATPMNSVLASEDAVLIAEDAEGTCVLENDAEAGEEAVIDSEDDLGDTAASIEADEETVYAADEEAETKANTESDTGVETEDQEDEIAVISIEEVSFEDAAAEIGSVAEGTSAAAVEIDEISAVDYDDDDDEDEDDVDYEGVCGDTVTYCKYSDGRLVISGSGAMYDYTNEEGSPWEGVSSITSIIVEDGVTSIGAYAFYCCWGLTSVEIPDSVTSIGTYAFYTCEELTSISGGDNVTTVGGMAFYKTVWIENQEKVQNGSETGYYLGQAFISEIAKTGTCGESLTWMLSYDKALTISGTGAMDLSDTYFSPWEGYDVKTVIINSGVTTIDENAFMYCSDLQTVEIPNTVTSIGDGAFYTCTSLTEIYFPDSVTSIGENAFYGSGLATITGGNGISKVGNYAFSDTSWIKSQTKTKAGLIWGCYLGSAFIPTMSTDVADESGSGWFELNGLKCYLYYVELSDGTVMITGASADTYSNQELTDKTISSFGSAAFCSYYYGEDAISFPESWEIPEGVEYIGSLAFMLQSLQEAIMPDSLREIASEAFYEYPGWYMMEPCGTITSVVLNEGLETIGDSAFVDCLMTEITIPASVTEIGDCAFGYEFSCYDDDGYPVFVKMDDFTIKGYSGTAAETYAAENGFTFIALDQIVDISSYTVTLSASDFTCDGTAKTPDVTVLDGTATLINGTDYTVVYSDNTEVGTATVTITGTGNYTGTITKTFAISKADQTVTINTAASSIVAGNTITITASGQGTITYSSSDTSIATVSDNGAVTGLAPGTVIITATAAGNQSCNAASGSVTITVTLGSGVISSLTNTAKGIKIKWEQVTGASGYYIYRKTSSGKYKKIQTIAGSSTVSYTDTSVKSKKGKIYTYKVVPYSGTTEGSSIAETTVRLTGVKLSSVKSASSKKATVKWEKTSKVSGYQIQYSMSKSFAGGNMTKKVSGASKTSVTLTGLKKGKTYYMRIRAYKKVNGKTYYSAWSGKKKVKVS